MCLVPGHLRLLPTSSLAQVFPPPVWGEVPGRAKPQAGVPGGCSAATLLPQMFSSMDPLDSLEHYSRSPYLPCTSCRSPTYTNRVGQVAPEYCCVTVLRLLSLR